MNKFHCYNLLKTLIDVMCHEHGLQHNMSVMKENISEKGCLNEMVL